MREGRVEVRRKAIFRRPIASQKVEGRFSTKRILIGAFADLKPYFHGSVNQIGLPFRGGRR
jgi:hypothetical protein